VPGLSALAGGAGAELRAPLAVTVIAGLLLSSLLTLLVIPSAYAIVYGRSRGQRGAARGQGGAARGETGIVTP
jgi:Cu/Ag efflux pump CusA